MSEPEVALIVGAGSGLSAALARRFRAAGMEIALAARHTDKLDGLIAEVGGRAYQCDATEPAQVEALFATLEAEMGGPGLVVYNASGRVRGPLLELDPKEVLRCLTITTFGGFLVSQAAARRMIPAGRGTILLTGASASVKGFANSAPFAMGKFGLRGLAQSLARELQPQNIHVAHVVVDGGIANPARDRGDRGEDGFLDPAAIAETYFHLHSQHRSAWSWEVEVRPWRETF